MSEAAQVTIAATPTRVWRVLADVERWPSWSPSVLSVAPETASDLVDGTVAEQTAYRIDQPPLPHSLWTVNDWRPGQGFSWQTQGASSSMTMTFRLRPHAEGSRVAMDLQWSGAMAWMARAAYGPVSIRHAGVHLTALRQVCEAGTAGSHGD